MFDDYQYFFPYISLEESYDSTIARLDNFAFINPFWVNFYVSVYLDLDWGFTGHFETPINNEVILISILIIPYINSGI